MAVIQTPFEAIRSCLIKYTSNAPAITYKQIADETGIPTATLYRLLSPDNEDKGAYGIYPVPNTRPRLVEYNAELEMRHRKAKAEMAELKLLEKSVAIREAQAFLLENSITWYERRILENLRSAIKSLFPDDTDTVMSNFENAKDRGSLSTYAPLMNEHSHDPERLHLIFAMALVTPATELLRKEASNG